MALIAADLTYPTGKLQESSFPGKDLQANLTVWLPAATAKTAGLAAGVRDIAATHYVYYLAFSAIADRIASQPSAETFSGPQGTNVSRNWGQNRAEYWLEKAQAEWDAFSIYVPDDSANVMQRPPVSGSARVRGVF